jgi:YbbR domain-containing protein
MTNKLHEFFKNKAKLMQIKMKRLNRYINSKSETFLQTRVFLIGISLFISVMIWAFVAWNGNTDGTRSMPVQIKYVNLERGYSISDNTQQVDIKLVGRLNALSRVVKSDVSAQVDLQGLQPGKYSLPINIRIPSYVRIRGWEPSNANVEIYRHVERTIPITWRVEGDEPEGMIVSSVDIKPSKATLSGPEDEVLAVQTIEAAIPADKLDTGDYIRVPLSVVSQSRDKDKVSIVPEHADIKAILEHEMIGEKVPVKVTVIGQPAEGLEVDSINVTPDQVTVSGKSEAVRKMSAIVLPPVDISGLDQNLNLLLPLQPAESIPDVEISGPDRARVEITVRKKMASKTFTNVAIMVEGGKTEKEWRILPQSVRLTVEGPQAAMEILPSGSTPCELYVDVSNVVSRQLTLPVLVKNLKKEFKVLHIEPEQVVVTLIE